MKMRNLFPAILLVASSMFLANCSSSSSTTEPTTLSTNISGTWSGATTFFGTPTTVTLAITQPTSDAAATALSLSGMITLNSGTPLAVSGTKEGNSWTVSGNNGTTIVSIHQTLTSATQSTGDFTLQIGPPSNKGTVSLDLTKS